MLISTLNHLYRFCEFYVVVLSWCVIPLAFYGLLLLIKRGAAEPSAAIESHETPMQSPPNVPSKDSGETTKERTAA